MVTAKTIPNIILDSGGTNELTIYTTSCEKVYSKTLVKLTPPQTQANWESGPKDTKTVDLLRIEVRYIVKGTIDSSDESKIQNLIEKGGVFKMTWKSTDFNINFEKLTITDDSKSENDETAIMFTALVGINL